MKAGICEEGHCSANANRWRESKDRGGKTHVSERGGLACALCVVGGRPRFAYSCSGVTPGPAKTYAIHTHLHLPQLPWAGEGE